MVRHGLKVPCYGRYMDDMVLVHEDNALLRRWREDITYYLRESRGLDLSRDKSMLMCARRGVPWLGSVVRVGHVEPGRRTLSNCERMLEGMDGLVEDHRPRLDERRGFRGKVNSYLALMRSHPTYARRSELLGRVDARWWRWFWVPRGNFKVVAWRTRKVQRRFRRH